MSLRNGMFAIVAALSLSAVTSDADAQWSSPYDTPPASYYDIEGPLFDYCVALHEGQHGSTFEDNRQIAWCMFFEANTLWYAFGDYSTLLYDEFQYCWQTTNSYLTCEWLLNLSAAWYYAMDLAGAIAANWWNTAQLYE